jgi:AmiR/NasT family two-component response regulator
MTPSRTLKVLIVDDEALVSNVVQSELELLGHKVIGRAADGLRAVEMAARLVPDVIVMDVVMPEMDGIEATKRIQRDCPRPVVLLTAHDDPEMVQKASEAGAGAYLVKPPNGPELGRTLAIAIARFEDLMELRRLNQELREAQTQVKTLQGLLPICSHCKRIRDEDDKWLQVETYISRRVDAKFTHSICPDCMRIWFPR